jgi:acyl-CoA synthetase (AMP-forming)/AMP-acid ligase II
MVIPNGPELALAVIGVASCATAAPLNPKYTRAEFDFYLDDLKARAVMLPAGYASAIRDAARDRDIQIVEFALDATLQNATLTAVSAGATVSNAPPAAVGNDSVALVLHTSGTTSRPKIVPLTHDNICTSAANIARTLGLTPSDCCLNVMPLFHIHGLVAGLFSSLVSGGSVLCSPGFADDPFFAKSFFKWLAALKPTWYTAVPTMHQAILARAGRQSEALAQSSLRFIRSSSASLPPPVMAELERTFGVPVVEAFGMTEAAHQICCNPLPPAKRKPKSVGLAAGPDVCILGEDGARKPAGERGEIAIRGRNVIKAYENNATANAASFRGEWFRTGDEGYFDDEGYLFITGRLKEMINRGGEKISPREIDEVLLEHPAVAQAVAFAAPHPTLGETVAAAVVLRENCRVEADELRRFSAQSLADFKIPAQFVFVSAIPNGPTGKPQRIGMLERLFPNQQGVSL